MADKQNRGKSINSQLSPEIKGKQPMISSTAPEFDDKHQKIVGVIEKSYDFNAGKTQSQATDDNFFTKKCNLDGQTTLCCGTGKSVATLVPIISHGTALVKKVADAGSGSSNAPNENNNNVRNQNNNVRNQNNNVQQNENNNENDHVVRVTFLRPNEGEELFNDEDIEYLDDSDGEVVDAIRDGEPITIYRFNVNLSTGKVSRRPTEISTEIIANHYESWGELAQQIHQVYLTRGDDDDNYGRPRLRLPDASLCPYSCWPGCWTNFAVVHEDGYVYPVDSDNRPFDDYRGIVNAFLVHKPFLKRY